MYPQRFSDDRLQALGGQINATVGQLCNTGQAARAAELLCRFVDTADAAIAGPERPARGRLADYFGEDSDRHLDSRFLWLMTAELLHRFPPLRERLAGELAALCDRHTTPPHILCTILRYIAPAHLEAAMTALYDRLDAADLPQQHACYQRLGFGLETVYAALPRLRRRRAESYRRMVARVALQLGPQRLDRGSAVARAAPRQPRRLALLSARLAGKRHSPSRVLALYAEGLRVHAGAELALFETRDLELAQDEHMLFARLNWPEASGDILDRLHAAGIRYCPAEPQASRLEEIARQLEAVRAWRPDAVLSFGASDSVVKGLLAREMPVLDFHLGGQFLMHQDADLILTPQSREAVEAEARESAMPERLAAYCRHDGALDVPPAPTPMPRASLGLAAGATVLATVGNTLDRIMSEPFLARMAGLLEARPEVQWLVIGPRQPPRLAAMLQDPGLAGRILRREFEAELPTALAACDIYVHPVDGEGGGFAAVDALAAGCPVVASSGHDVGLVIGERYACAGDADYWALLERLVAVPAAARPLAAEMLADLRRRRGIAPAVAQVIDALDRVAARRAAAA